MFQHARYQLNVFPPFHSPSLLTLSLPSSDLISSLLSSITSTWSSTKETVAWSDQTDLLPDTLRGQLCILYCCTTLSLINFTKPIYRSNKREARSLTLLRGHILSSVRFTMSASRILKSASWKTLCNASGLLLCPFHLSAVSFPLTTQLHSVATMTMSAVVSTMIRSDRCK